MQSMGERQGLGGTWKTMGGIGRASAFAGALLGMLLGGCASLEKSAERDGMPRVFSEDFANGSGRWVMTDARAWRVEKEGGRHLLSLFGKSAYEPEVRSPRNIARVKNLELGGFVFEVTLRQTGREYGHRDLCLFFGYNDPSHFYYVHMASAADAHAHSIFLVNGAPRVSIAAERTDGIQWGEKFHKVRITRDTASGSIEVYFDDMDTPIMKANDKTFLKGGFGIGSFDDTGNFDRVAIWGA